MSSKSSSPLKNFVAGGFGGSCLVFAGHPLDTIKVRLQTQPELYKGTIDCTKKTIVQDGFLGLYKGMAAPLAGVCPMYAICFLSFTFGKKIQQKSEDEQLTLFQLAKAGFVAGLATTAILAPGERIKCILQVQSANPQASGPKFAGPMDCFKHLYRNGGIRNVYVGTLATACRDVPATGMYFMSYEFFQRKLTPEGKSRDQLSPGRILLSGGLAGICNWLVAIPADVLKSKQQTAPQGTYNGLIDVLNKTVKTEGMKGLYRGAAPTLLRAFPANAACFFGYESAMKLLNYTFPE